MTYFAYLDEFGHIGPYVSRTDPRYKQSPVFGLAGYVLPAQEVRGFATWFFQRKRELLHSDIQRAGKHPALWEKKGSHLFTAKSVRRYHHVRNMAYRLLNKIEQLGGFVFYVGIEKARSPKKQNSLYVRSLSEVTKRIDQFCSLNCAPSENFILILDEHPMRSELITTVSKSMYSKKRRRRCIIEPLFQVESHRYQTIQAADWIATLIERILSVDVEPRDFRSNNIFTDLFHAQIERTQKQSGLLRRY